MGFDLTYQPLNQNDKNLSSHLYKEEDMNIQHDNHIVAWLRTQPKAMHLIMRLVLARKRGRA